MLSKINSGIPFDFNKREAELIRSYETRGFVRKVSPQVVDGLKERVEQVNQGLASLKEEYSRNQENYNRNRTQFRQLSMIVSSWVHRIFSPKKTKAKTKKINELNEESRTLIGESIHLRERAILLKRPVLDEGYPLNSVPIYQFETTHFGTVESYAFARLEVPVYSKTSEGFICLTKEGHDWFFPKRHHSSSLGYQYHHEDIEPYDPTRFH